MPCCQDPPLHIITMSFTWSLVVGAVVGGIDELEMIKRWMGWNGMGWTLYCACSEVEWGVNDRDHPRTQFTGCQQHGVVHLLGTWERANGECVTDDALEGVIDRTRHPP